MLKIVLEIFYLIQIRINHLARKNHKTRNGRSAQINTQIKTIDKNELIKNENENEVTMKMKMIQTMTVKTNNHNSKHTRRFSDSVWHFNKVNYHKNNSDIDTDGNDGFNGAIDAIGDIKKSRNGGELFESVQTIDTTDSGLETVEIVGDLSQSQSVLSNNNLYESDLVSIEPCTPATSAEGTNSASLGADFPYSQSLRNTDHNFGDYSLCVENVRNHNSKFRVSGLIGSRKLTASKIVTNYNNNYMNDSTTGNGIINDDDVDATVNTT